MNFSQSNCLGCGCLGSDGGVLSIRLVLAYDSVEHRFSKCSVRSPRAPREKPRGSASYSFTYVFILRNFLWGSVNYGKSLRGLHNTKSLRTPAGHVNTTQHCRVGCLTSVCWAVYRGKIGKNDWVASRVSCKAPKYRLHRDGWPGQSSSRPSVLGTLKPRHPSRFELSPT